MSFWQRIRRIQPLMLLICALVISSPWLFNFRYAYASSPASWLVYAGAVFVCVGWLIAGYVYEAHRDRDNGMLGLAYIGAFVAIGAIGLTLIFFNSTIYFHGRMLAQQTAMERVIVGGDVCPRATRCERDDGVTFFVWGAEEHIRTGACHDPSGRIVAFDRDTDTRVASATAGAPQIFGGAVTVAQPRGGEWYECAISTAPRLVVPTAN